MDPEVLIIEVGDLFDLLPGFEVVIAFDVFRRESRRATDRRGLGEDKIPDVDNDGELLFPIPRRQPDRAPVFSGGGFSRDMDRDPDGLAFTRRGWEGSLHR